MGYHRAGFEVVGVDITPQPRYPFEFVQADALTFPLDGYDAIHASPPCQAYSVGTARWRGRQAEHPDLIAAVRERLQAAGVPYAIENVTGAPLVNALQFCGSAFGLDIQRHRLFECSFPIMAPPCAHHWQTPRFPPNRSGRRGRRARVITVAGRGGPREDMAEGGGKARVEEWRRVMGIDWMTRDELAEAIPPAYTEHVGRYLETEVAARQVRGSEDLVILPERPTSLEIS
jgi:DNA (cytosine-5)-methyltransferase 1